MTLATPRSFSYLIRTAQEPGRHSAEYEKETAPTTKYKTNIHCKSLFNIVLAPVRKKAAKSTGSFKYLFRNPLDAHAMIHP
jgi:hypothetical protein